MALKYLDKSGSIASGGTAQWVDEASDSSRQRVTLRNNSNSEMRFGFTSALVGSTTGLPIEPGQTWESPDGEAPAGPISVYGTTTSDAFSCLIAVSEVPRR